MEDEFQNLRAVFKKGDPWTAHVCKTVTHHFSQRGYAGLSPEPQSADACAAAVIEAWREPTPSTRVANNRKTLLERQVVLLLRPRSSGLLVRDGRRVVRNTTQTPLRTKKTETPLLETRGTGAATPANSRNAGPATHSL